MAFLDVTNCGNSSVAADEGTYAVTSLPITSPITGRFITSYGHVHDGGQMVTVTQNNATICSSPQLYGREKAFIEPDVVENTKSTNPGLAHISDVGTCQDDLPEIKKGDVFTVSAVYDTEKNPLMKMEDGMHQELMGIALSYVVIEENDKEGKSWPCGASKELCETDTQAKTGLGGIIGTLAGNVPATQKPEDGETEGEQGSAEEGGMGAMDGMEGMGDEHADTHAAPSALATETSAAPVSGGEPASTEAGSANVGELHVVGEQSMGGVFKFPGGMR